MGRQEGVWSQNVTSLGKYYSCRILRFFHRRFEGFKRCSGNLWYLVFCTSSTQSRNYCCTHISVRPIRSSLRDLDRSFGIDIPLIHTIRTICSRSGLPFGIYMTPLFLSTGWPSGTRMGTYDSCTSTHDDLIITVHDLQYPMWKLLSAR